MMMRLRMLLVLCAAVALSAGVASATAGGGNSANAKKCQKGGWKTLVRADHTAFKNQGDCVSYAAKGGTLTPKSHPQIDCESFGGTFSTDPATDHIGLPRVVIWTCNGASVSLGSDAALELSADCGLDSGGSTYAYTSVPPFDATCYQ
jgi:hypothetical protein